MLLQARGLHWLPYIPESVETGKYDGLSDEGTVFESKAASTINSVLDSVSEFHENIGAKISSQPALLTWKTADKRLKVFWACLISFEKWQLTMTRCSADYVAGGNH